MQSSQPSAPTQTSEQAYQQGLALYQYGFASGFDAINAANLFEQANRPPTTTTTTTPLHLDALCRYGECCLWGKGVQQNQKKATECFQQVAAKGHTLGTYYLGYCHLMGIGGIKKDATQAQTYFDQAIKTWTALAGPSAAVDGSGQSSSQPNSSVKTDPEAQFWLGWCYEQSYGFEVPNFELAVNWYELAAKAGHSNAMYYLAMYLRSSATNDKEKVEKAKKLLEEAALKGHPGAKKELKKEKEAEAGTSPLKK
jgi:TPR repeat protein